MPDIILFHFPSSCSRVTMNALEEIGADFEARTINLREGLQISDEYLAINPKGKVPALSFDGTIITENPAIIAFLHSQYPDAGLLPEGDSPAGTAQGLSDLIWCASTLHPTVRQIRAPTKLTQGDPAGVREDGGIKFAKECKRINERLAATEWWYGDGWSILDVYISWACNMAAKGNAFPLDEYPAIRAHAERVRGRPSFQRALQREEAAVLQHDIAMPDGL